jgi:hypothetical protein
MCKGKGQNRIEYIVYHNPGEASRVLDKYGYETPRKKEDLATAMKQLVRKKGEPVIKELMLIHPERKLMLQATGHSSDESNFCGCHSAYTGELKDYLDKLSGMSESDLAELYDEAKKKAKEKPDDKAQMGQVEAIWDELKRRKKNKDEAQKKNSDDSEKQVLYMALAFFAGLVIAKVA